MKLVGKTKAIQLLKMSALAPRPSCARASLPASKEKGDRIPAPSRPYLGTRTLKARAEGQMEVFGQFQFFCSTPLGIC